jgi:hypothetical protein
MKETTRLEILAWLEEAVDELRALWQIGVDVGLPMKQILKAVDELNGLGRKERAKK